MPREPRKESDTRIYHVIVRGIGQQDIFYEEDDCQRYLETTKKVSLESGVSVLGYCLMSNHVHLLLREGYGDISVYMKRLGISYAYWYNWKYERNVTQENRPLVCMKESRRNIEALTLTIVLSMGKKPQVLLNWPEHDKKVWMNRFIKNLSLCMPGELMNTLPRDQKDFVEGTYLLKVSLSRGKWRKIELAAKHNLDQLHLAIQEAFEFDDDHLHSFFMDNKKWSHDSYESPLGEGPYADEVTIGELGLYPGKTFLNLFDYGDEWEFKVEVEEISPDKPLPLTPKIVGIRGEAPDQYGYGY